jgi:hypothetical protein
MEFWSKRSTGGKVAIVGVLVSLLCAVLALGIFRGGIMGPGSGRQAAATTSPEADLATATAGGDGARAPAEAPPASGPVPPTQPDKPAATANIPLNIHAGPGQTYPLIGVMGQGQTARIVGRSPDGQWWAIDFPATFDGLGWISAGPVMAVNTGNLPVVEPPPPMAITGRQGEKKPDPRPPKAIINGATRVQIGQRASLNAKNFQVSEGSHIESFLWDFGDGATGSGVYVTHIYEQTGFYEVRLALTDDKGFSDTDRHSLEVTEAPVAPESEQPPQAVINAPGEGFVNQSILFDAGESRSTNPIAGYAWEFGDGTSADAFQVNKAYSAAGLYNVRLTLTDDKGLQGSIQKQIRIVENGQVGNGVGE